MVVGVCRAGFGRRGTQREATVPLEQQQVPAVVLCPGTIAQTARSKFKELKDTEVSSNNQRTSGGQSLTNETRSCF